MKIASFNIILLLIISSNLCSQGIPYGQEFRMISDTLDNQMGAAIARLKDGGYVICWDGDGNKPGTSERDVFGQLFDETGIKKSSEFCINTYTTDSQFDPSIAELKDGGFITCWNSYNQDGSECGIYGQIFNAVGEKKGKEFQVNTYINDYQSFPSVAGLQNGGFVICWESWPSYGHIGQDGSGSGIFAQIFSSSGVKIGKEFQINTYTNGNQSWPSVACLKDGSFVVCWDSIEKNSYTEDVFCQLFDVSGNKIGAESEVNSNKEGYQSFPSVARLPDGGFVVCWQSHNQDGSYISSQIFNASGTPKGNEFHVNAYTQNDQYLPSIAVLNDGDFLICWESWGQFSSSYDIVGQMVNATGVKQGNNFLINKFNMDFQRQPVVAKVQSDKILVCWHSYNPHGGMTKIFGKYLLTEPITHPLKAYFLLGPLNDATVNTTQITFSWQQPSKIRECYPWEIIFDLYLDSDSNFPNPQIIKNIEDTTYTIYSLAAGKTYFWKVLAKNLAGDSLWSQQQDWGFFIKPGATSVETAAQNLPSDFALFQNYPNPFNSSTEIRYCLPNGNANYQVQLKIYDLLGRLVKVLVDQQQCAGSYSIRWDGTDDSGNVVTSGMYFYSFEAGEFKMMKKMLVVY